MNTVKRGLIELTLSSGGGSLQPVSLFQYVQECVGGLGQKKRHEASFLLVLAQDILDLLQICF